MALPLDLALTNYNARTCRYNFARGANGDVAFDQTQAFAVMSSCLCKRNGYWADANFGSDLDTLRNMTSRTPSQAQAMTADAVQPLVDQKLITGVQVGAVAAASSGAIGASGNPAAGNQLDVDLNWATPGGGPGGNANIRV
jgi:phage gp46-like protein